MKCSKILSFFLVLGGESLEGGRRFGFCIFFVGWVCVVFRGGFLGVFIVREVGWVILGFILGIGFLLCEELYVGCFI